VHAVRQADLQQALHLPLPQDELPQALRRAAQIYYAVGLVHATFTTQSHGEHLSIVVAEGEPVILENLFLRGLHVLSEPEARDRLGLRPGQPFRYARLEARLQELLREYSGRGYLDANVVVERLEIASGGVTVGLVITEGDVATLQEVQVHGNTHSQSQLIERIAGLRLAQPANLQRIAGATHTLRRSGLFEMVQEPLLYRTGTSPTDVGVLMRVVEAQRRNTVFGTVGVARNPLTGSPYVSGAVDLQLRNIWGTGRDVDVDWRRDAIRGSNLFLGYRERFVFGSPFDVELQLGQTVRDSTYTYQTLSAGLRLPVRRSLSVHFGTAVDRSVFHTATQGNSLRLRQRIGLQVEGDGREIDGDAFGLLAVYLEYARKSNDLMTSGIEDRSKVRQTVWRGNYDAGVPIGHKHVIGLRGQWYFIDSNEAEVPESELFWFGGARSPTATPATPTSRRSSWRSASASSATPTWTRCSTPTQAPRRTRSRSSWRASTGTSRARWTR
jgi:outer membrane protein assembly factor BamA